MRATAVASWERTELAFGAGGGDVLACVYATVDAARDPVAARFLRDWRRCCDVVALDWAAAARTRRAHVGVELSACCGARDTLRLVLDVGSHRAALQALAETEVLVVASGAEGAVGTRVAAYAVDGPTVTAATLAAVAGLRRLTAALN